MGAWCGMKKGVTECWLQAQRRHSVKPPPRMLGLQPAARRLVGGDRSTVRPPRKTSPCPSTSFTEVPPLTASQLSSHNDRPPDPAATAGPCSLGGLNSQSVPAKNRMSSVPSFSFCKQAWNEGGYVGYGVARAWNQGVWGYGAAARGSIADTYP